METGKLYYEDCHLSRFTATVQLVSYGVVGAVVIAVYQVLMLPMQMLGTL